MIGRIDEELKKRNSMGAIFHKSVFHVHTPASFDYGLFKKNDLNSLTDETLLSLLKTEGIPIDKDLHTIEGLKELDKSNTFINGRELALFCLIANRIVKQKIDLVLVTDHNTISGIPKLNEACIINKKYLKCFFPKILWGIEISCSDKHHVVVILDERDNKMIESVKSWLDEYIISKDGTYLPSLIVIEEFISMGAIAYIAHFNTSDMFKEPKFLNGTYKKKLFTVPEMKVIGLSDLKKEDWIRKQINPTYTNRNFNFILDEDSHTLDELGAKPFWIKGQSLNFDTIRYAFEDFDNSISFEEVIPPTSYIKALYIEGKTFIKSNNKSGAVFTFSPRMNCFIGGRGSGKSTVLNTLEFLVSQIIENKKNFDAILPQGDLCVLCEYNGIDYYISSIDSSPKDNEIFKRNYFLEDHLYSDFDSVSDISKRKEVLERIQVWKKNDGKHYEVTKQKEILDKIFTRKFSVSNLVNSASNNNSVNNFLQNMIQSDRVLKRKVIINPSNEWKSIKRAVDKITNRLSEQEEKLILRVKEYNIKNKNRLRITYDQLPINKFRFRWEDVIHLTKTNAKEIFSGYNITYGEVVAFLDDLSCELNPFLLIKKIDNKEYNEIEMLISVEQYVIKNEKKTFELELKKIEDKHNKLFFFEHIRKLLHKVPWFVVSEMKRYYSKVDKFGLEFNVHSRSGLEQRNPEYIPISELSMGQKVVTMLNFILSFSEFIEDYSPLIIDQPEDNLDNQYIYNNLVQIFKDLKHSRQVIIASHNSTIVVNSSTEQIYVMDSDAKHGWIEKRGFCKENNILIDIINKLEGGMTAFNKKNWLYKSVTNKSNSLKK